MAVKDFYNGLGRATSVCSAGFWMLLQRAQWTRLLLVVFALPAVVGSTILISRAAQPPTSISPDQILKGSAPTITITLDKSIPDQNEIKIVRVAGQSISVNPPTAEGRLYVSLPKLDITGRADVEVIGKGDRVVAGGQLTYVESAEAPSVLGVKSSVVIVVGYVLLIVLLPWAATLYDIRKSYAAQQQMRSEIFSKLPGNVGVDELRVLLSEMNQGPPGMTGLTRGAVALTLLLVLGIAVFHIVVLAPRIPDMAEKLLTLLAGAFTSITGFYFGTRTVTEGAQQQSQGRGGVTPSSGSAPVITGVNPPTGPAGTTVTLTGQAFGAVNGTVSFGTMSGTIVTWTDTSIEVKIPPGLTPGKVGIIVKTASGNVSKPIDFTVT